MKFQFSLLAALEATAGAPESLDAFASEVLGTEYSNEQFTEFFAQMTTLLETMNSRLNPALAAVEAGPGRVDGVGQATNETLCFAFGIPENCKTFNAPTNPGFLWGLGDLSWVQSNGSVHGALPRNVGEALGVFGPHRLVDGQIKTELPLFSLMTLEEGFEALRPPRWNDPQFETVLPPLNVDTVVAGKTIYAATCGGCHGNREDGPFTPVNSLGERFVEVPVTPLAEIGTDPSWLNDFVSEVALAPAEFIEAKGDLYVQAFGTSSPSTPVPAAQLRAMVIRDTIGAFLTQEGIAPGTDEFNRLVSYRDNSFTRTPAETMGYRAQPMEGVAFTGPYLHNGSVRTLAELLKPAAERERTFWVGGNVFEPDTVGFRTNPEETNAYLFDTALSGNHNSGHEGPAYGTELSDSDKQALLEYLRSL